MDTKRLLHLLNQYFANTIGEDDCRELLNYLQVADQQEVSAIIEDTNLKEGLDVFWAEERVLAVHQIILSDKRFIEASPKRIIKNYKYLTIAASLLIAAFIGLGWYFYSQRYVMADSATGAKNNIITPGHDKAILTVADQTFNLDSLSGINTIVAHTKILQQGNAINYLNLDSKNSEVVFNKLKTPRGGKFSVVLEDGTKVWLNAGSQLTYPSRFAEDQRIVSLSGEAYFEVAKSKKRPFKVMTNNTTVEVLGTHFNISAYTDDRLIKTTLVEGSVKVKSTHHSVILKPGEQAMLDFNNGKTSISSVDVSIALGWKDGYLVFKDEDITSIMKKISRWYDVDVVFEKQAPENEFGGKFKSNKPLQELLANLEILCEMKFKVEGRRIIVM